jgi:hypothetical protein
MSSKAKETASSPGSLGITCKWGLATHTNAPRYRSKIGLIGGTFINTEWKQSLEPTCVYSVDPWQGSRWESSVSISLLVFIGLEKTVMCDVAMGSSWCSKKKKPAEPRNCVVSNSFFSWENSGGWHCSLPSLQGYLDLSLGKTYLILLSMGIVIPILKNYCED